MLLAVRRRNASPLIDHSAHILKDVNIGVRISFYGNQISFLADGNGAQ